MDVRRLKGEIVANGYTQATVAKAIGMSERTFTNRMRTGVFKTDEVEKITEILNLENPLAIFFTPRGTSNAPKEGG